MNPSWFARWWMGKRVMFANRHGLCFRWWFKQCWGVRDE